MSSGHAEARLILVKTRRTACSDVQVSVLHTFIHNVIHRRAHCCPHCYPHSGVDSRGSGAAHIPWPDNALTCSDDQSSRVGRLLPGPTSTVHALQRSPSRHVSLVLSTELRTVCTSCSDTRCHGQPAADASTHEQTSLSPRAPPSTERRVFQSGHGIPTCSPRCGPTSRETLPKGSWQSVSPARP